MNWDSMINLVTAAGAIGTAAMGLVQALKTVRFWKIGPLADIGVRTIKERLGDPAIGALRLVYGPDDDDQFLKSAWRRKADDFAKVVRNGLRMAVFADLPDLKKFIKSFGQDADEISAAVKRLREGGADKPDGLPMAVARERVARLEGAIDARVDAAVAAGQDFYVGMMQVVAALIAIATTRWVFVQKLELGGRPLTSAEAILIGVLAVPIAPVAKDIVTFLNSARSTFLKGKKGT